MVLVRRRVDKHDKLLYQIRTNREYERRPTESVSVPSKKKGKDERGAVFGFSEDEGEGLIRRKADRVGCMAES